MTCTSLTYVTASLQSDDDRLVMLVVVAGANLEHDAHPFAGNVIYILVSVFS